MKKILLFIFAFLLIGCTDPQEIIDKDIKLLKSRELRYDQIALRWNDPHFVTYVNEEKFVAIWKKDLGFGQIYDVKILFHKQRVIGWTIDDSKIKRSLTDELLSSLE
jgi:hypothetical protein